MLISAQTGRLEFEEKMKINNPLLLLAGVVPALLAPCSAGAAEGWEGHKLEFVARIVGFDVDFQNTATPPVRTAYQQTALGLQLNYESPLFANFIGAGVSAYSVHLLAADGINNASENSTQLLNSGTDGKLEESYQTLGQAYLVLQHENLASLKIGRQLQDSLLLKSATSRAVPDTYSGISGRINPSDALKIYVAVYDKWRPRSGADFEKFKTDLSQSATIRSRAGDIDYVSILGTTYASGPFSATLEYLNSKDYLTKYGLAGAYAIPLEAKNKLTLSGGYFASQDAGDLFVCGAESEVDCASTAAGQKGTPLSNDGKGIFLDADIKLGNVSIGAAVAKFDGMWIEDNFSVDSATPNTNATSAYINDHGTTPFPTSASMGPDLSNNKETLWSVRLGYNWSDYIKGLSTAVKYVKGTGAKNSYDETLGSGSETYSEFDLKYAFPFAKGMSFRYLFMDYDTERTGVVAGLTRRGETNHRLYLDYVYRF